MMPIWFFSYKFHDKDYYFAMNGQQEGGGNASNQQGRLHCGGVRFLQGFCPAYADRGVDTMKKKLGIFTVFIMVFCVIFIFMMKLKATRGSDDGVRVFDDAGLLTDEEEQNFRKRLIKP